MVDLSQAQFRHATYYMNALQDANTLFEQGAESLYRGLDLFDIEWSNIQAGHAWAEEHASSDYEASLLCNRYPDAGAELLQLRQHPRERVKWLSAALFSARQLKDRAAEGKHLGNLGVTYGYLAKFSQAKECFEQHLSITQEIGDRRGEGQALGNLGNIYTLLGESHKAIKFYQKRFSITREIGDRLGESQSLRNLGAVYFELGKASRAIKFQKQGLALTRDLGDRHGEAQALDNLGNACAVLGDINSAVEYHKQALVIARQIGDRRHEGAALGNLGNRYADLGETTLALNSYNQQLSIARATGDPESEGNALWSLALDKLGDRPQAITYAEAALKVYEQFEGPRVSQVRQQLSHWSNKKWWKFWK
jgi:tetratricopeptide (TPR) repeat protein